MLINLKIHLYKIIYKAKNNMIIVVKKRYYPGFGSNGIANKNLQKLKLNQQIKYTPNLFHCLS